MNFHLQNKNQLEFVTMSNTFHVRLVVWFRELHQSHRKHYTTILINAPSKHCKRMHYSNEIQTAYHNACNTLHKDICELGRHCTRPQNYFIRIHKRHLSVVSMCCLVMETGQEWNGKEKIPLSQQSKHNALLRCSSSSPQNRVTHPFLIINLLHNLWFLHK